MIELVSFEMTRYDSSALVDILATAFWGKGNQANAIRKALLMFTNSRQMLLLQAGKDDTNGSNAVILTVSHRRLHATKTCHLFKDELSRVTNPL